VKWTEKILIGILILLPFGVSVFVPFSPLPRTLNDSRKAAALARANNDLAGESSALETILAYTPWQGTNWQRLGRLRLDQGNTLAAVDAFEQASVLGDLSYEGMLWMADALDHNGEKEKASELLRQFSLISDVDAFTLLQAALIQRSINDTNGALVNLIKAYEKDPLNGEINYQIGLQLAATQPDESLPFLERAGRLVPERLIACENLAQIITDSNTLKMSGARYLSIGQELATMQEWDVAQRAFENAAEMSPADGEAWALLAEAAQQNSEEGGEYLQKARELAPDDELVNGLSGLYYRRQGKSELAMVYLQRALKVNTKAVVWEIELGNTLDGMGNLADAIQHYQAATQIDPTQWMPWRVLATFCVTRNYQLEETGLLAAQKALELYPGSPALMDLLGTALMMDGQLDEALKIFLKADSIDPNQSAILIHIGQVYLELGENEKAFESLRQARDYARDNRLRELSIRLLQENGAVE